MVSINFWRNSNPFKKISFFYLSIGMDQNLSIGAGMDLQQGIGIRISVEYKSKLKTTLTKPCFKREFLIFYISDLNLVTREGDWK